MLSFKEAATGNRFLNGDFKPILEFLLTNPVSYTKRLVDETMVVTVTNHGGIFPDTLDITPLTKLYRFNPLRVDDDEYSFDVFSFSLDALAISSSLETVFYMWLVNNLTEENKSMNIKRNGITIDGVEFRE